MESVTPQILETELINFIQTEKRFMFEPPLANTGALNIQQIFALAVMLDTQFHLHSCTDAKGMLTCNGPSFNVNYTSRRFVPSCTNLFLCAHNTHQHCYLMTNLDTGV